MLVALLLALRFAAHSLGPDDTARTIHGSAFYAVATGWLHGLRTVVGTPSVAATLAGLAAHRIAFGINTMLMLVIVRHTEAQGFAGLGIAVVFARGHRHRCVHRNRADAGDRAARRPVRGRQRGAGRRGGRPGASAPGWCCR